MRTAPLRAQNKKNHHTAVCSITDPFCIHARAAQRPDGGPPSIPFQIRQVIDVTNDTTTGTSRSVFVPAGGLFWGQGYSTVTGKWDMPGNWQAAGQTMLTNLAEEIRIVSFGVIFRCTASATNAKGIAIISVDPAPKQGAQQIVKGVMSGGECNIISIAAGTEYTFRSKPLGPLAHSFHPVSKFTNTMTDFDWTSCAFEVQGSDISGPVSVFSAEYVLNLEFTVRAAAPSAGSTASYGMSQLQKPPPAPNSFAIKAADRVHATVPSLIEGGIAKVGNYLEKQAMSALDSVMSEGLALLAF